MRERSTAREAPDAGATRRNAGSLVCDRSARRVRAVLGAVFTLAAAFELPAAPCVLEVSITGKESAALLPCRAWVSAGETRWYRPVGHSSTPSERDRSFACEGRFRMELPAGMVTLHVERGKEYLAVDKSVLLEEGRTIQLAIALERWIDMPKRGWFSADMHVHPITGNQYWITTDRAAEQVAAFRRMSLADDVNFVPVIGCWNKNADAWPAWADGGVLPIDDRHLLTLNNQEIERIARKTAPASTAVGALLLFGLEAPAYVADRDDTWPADAELCRRARASSPDGVIDTDKSLWPENAVGVALGLFDSVQLCHNHFHRDETRAPGWGMIGADLEPAGGTSPDDMMDRGNRVYYRWLNCGFHLAVSGGSAIGVMPVPLGQSRTYANLDGPLTAQRFLKAVRQGRTFATTGPMLLLTVDGHEVGATIDRSAGAAAVPVRAELHSAQPMEAIQLIQDGRTVASVDLTEYPCRPTLDYVLEKPLSVRRSGWIAARATFRRADGTLHQAHTSPVYLRVDGKPVAVRADAERMLRWLDRLDEVSRQPDRYRSEQNRAGAQRVFREARSVYEKIVQRAMREWND